MKPADKKLQCTPSDGYNHRQCCIIAMLAVTLRRAGFVVSIVVTDPLLNLLSHLSNRCGAFGPRALVIGVLTWSVVLLTGDALFAGCHYGADATKQYSSQGKDIGLRLFGQWIYEGGNVKHRPWQAAPPCQGPNCRGGDDLPVTTGLPSKINVRNLPTCSASSTLQFEESDRLIDRIRGENFFAFSGHPHDCEYPP